MPEPVENDNMNMKRGIAAIAALVLGSIGWAQEPSTPDALEAEIAALKPADHVWRAIPWKTCPLEALKASRDEKKPIIAWVFLGIPTDERC
jgi:hypothetical protein